MQLEGEIADLLDRRMMSLFGVDGKPATKLDVQNTSRKLQKAQHITTGNEKGATPAQRAHSSMESEAGGDKARASLSMTIGLNPMDTF